MSPLTSVRSVPWLVAVVRFMDVFLVARCLFPKVGSSSAAAAHAISSRNACMNIAVSVRHNSDCHGFSCVMCQSISARMRVSRANVTVVISWNDGLVISFCPHMTMWRHAATSSGVIQVIVISCAASSAVFSRCSVAIQVFCPIWQMLCSSPVIARKENDIGVFAGEGCSLLTNLSYGMSLCSIRQIRHALTWPARWGHTVL